MCAKILPKKLTNLGRNFTCLEDLGIRERTILIFRSVDVDPWKRKAFVACPTIKRETTICSPLFFNKPRFFQPPIWPLIHKTTIFLVVFWFFSTPTTALVFGPQKTPVFCGISPGTSTDLGSTLSPVPWVPLDPWNGIVTNCSDLKMGSGVHYTVRTNRYMGKLGPSRLTGSVCPLVMLFQVIMATPGILKWIFAFLNVTYHVHQFIGVFSWYPYLHGKTPPFPAKEKHGSFWFSICDVSHGNGTVPPLCPQVSLNYSGFLWGRGGIGQSVLRTMPTVSKKP